MLGCPDISPELCPCKVFSSFYSGFKRLLVVLGHLKYIRAGGFAFPSHAWRAARPLEHLFPPKTLPPTLSHHLSTIRRGFARGGRSSSGVPSIDIVPTRWRKASRGAQDPTYSLPASPCLSRAGICHLLSRSPLWPSFFFLFILLPELFKHLHLDIYMSGVTPLPLFPKSIISHCLDPCATTLRFY